MPPRPDLRSHSIPAWARAAHMHAPGLGVTTPDEYVASLADWKELAPHEVSFAQTHLQYLTVLALADVLAQLQGLDASIHAGTKGSREGMVALHRRLGTMIDSLDALGELAGFHAGEDPDDEDPDDEDPDDEDSDDEESEYGSPSDDDDEPRSRRAPPTDPDDIIDAANTEGGDTAPGSPAVTFPHPVPADD